jgi:hypothetical protein
MGLYMTASHEAFGWVIGTTIHMHKTFRLSNVDSTGSRLLLLGMKSKDRAVIGPRKPTRSAAEETDAGT